LWVADRIKVRKATRVLDCSQRMSRSVNNMPSGSVI